MPDGRSAECDMAEIRYVYEGNTYRDTVYGPWTVMIRKELSIWKSIDYLVDVVGDGGPFTVFLKKTRPAEEISLRVRIETFIQPGEGYIPPGTLKETRIEDDTLIIPEGLKFDVADRCARYFGVFLSTGDMDTATVIPHARFKRLYREDQIALTDMCRKVEESNDEYEQIGLMYAIASYDGFFRSGHTFYGRTSSDINIEQRTYLLEAARRCAACIERHGFRNSEVDFDGGYNYNIVEGYSDIITDDGIWDVYATHLGPDKHRTLHLLAQYLMGKNSLHRDEFEHVRTLGMYNAVTGTEYSIDLSDIPEETVYEVGVEVVGPVH